MKDDFFTLWVSTMKEIVAAMSDNFLLCTTIQLKLVNVV